MHPLGVVSSNWNQLRSNDGGGYLFLTGPRTTNINYSGSTGGYPDTVITPSGLVYNWNQAGLTINDPDGSTLFGYDALGRKLSVTHSADGSSQRWSYQGNTIGFWDEANSHTTYLHDAVNRLSGVLERTGTQTLETDYVYDLLNNLRTVNQVGVSGETPRSRSFTYDSLSRLITANNPKTGTICYGQWSSGSCMNGYDANGNLLTKTDARPVCRLHI